MGLRRTSLAAATALFLALIGTGLAARAVIGPSAEAPMVAAPKAAAPAPKVASAPRTPAETPFPKSADVVPAKAPVEARPAGKVEKQAPKPVVVASAPAAAPVATPSAAARLELAVNPWGEVFVDGKSRGLTPPLRTVEISPGSHTIEIRNSTFPVHVQKVVIKPGDAVKIRHKFK
jgi:hypothetical protein